MSSMPLPLPPVAGVEHTWIDLPTGVRIHLATAGPADAPAVLALHGWPQHWWCWRHVIARVGDAVRILCPDLRGLGWSGWPQDGSFVKQRLADDALALVDALGLERVRLVGHDWGGYAALLAALTAPERLSSLLMLSMPHPWQPLGRVLRNAWRVAYQLPLALPLAGEAVAREGSYVRMLLQGGRRDADGWGPGEVDAYVAALRAGHGPQASARLYRQFLVRETPGRLLDGLRRHAGLGVPARLLYGAHEPLRAFVEGFPGDIEPVPGAGHFLPEEAPDVVAERILAMG